MATRSLIGYFTNLKDGGWKATYHHWDGYPSGVGQKLFELHDSFFSRNVEVLINMIVDSRPNGWSTINANWFFQPVNMRTAARDYEGPLYYPEEEAMGLTTDSGDDYGAEWAYIFRRETNEMAIYWRDWDAGKWVRHAAISLDGSAPAWDALDDYSAHRNPLPSVIVPIAPPAPSKPARWVSCADTAKLVRSALKAAFGASYPGVKFSVKSHTYATRRAPDFGANRPTRLSQYPAQGL